MQPTHVKQTRARQEVCRRASETRKQSDKCTEQHTNRNRDAQIDVEGDSATHSSGCTARTGSGATPTDEQAEARKAMGAAWASKTATSYIDSIYVPQRTLPRIEALGVAEGLSGGALSFHRTLRAGVKYMGEVTRAERMNVLSLKKLSDPIEPDKEDEANGTQSDTTKREVGWTVYEREAALAGDAAADRLTDDSGAADAAECMRCA